jgi:hypothetical protein
VKSAATRQAQSGMILTRRVNTSCPQDMCPRRTTINGVKYYVIRPLNGVIIFKCIFCKHSVATTEFDCATGNRRTQAAAAINQHVKELHLSELRTAALVKSGSQGAL